MKNTNYEINIRSVETDNLPEMNEEVGYTGLSLGYDKYESYMPIRLPAVFAATELISNAIAQLPIHIRNKEGEILEDHPLNSVFTGNIQSKFIIMKQMIVDMLLDGDGIAYIYKNGDVPIGLRYVPATKVTITEDIDYNKVHYVVTDLNKNVPCDQSDVLHIIKNTNNGLKGIGLKYYAGNSIKLAGNTEQAANDYFNSGCSVNGILKSQNKLSSKQRQSILESWNSGRSQGKSSIVVMPVDLDYIPISNNAQDAQLSETRLFNLQEIARFFNINPILLGDLSKSSYTSIEAAQLEFLTHTLQPIITLVEDELNRKLCLGAYSDVNIDLCEEYLLRADKNSISNYLQKLTSSGIITINEARHLINMKAVDGGDRNFIPYTDIAQNTINTTKTSEKDKDEE